MESVAARDAEGVRGSNRRLFMRLFVAQDGMTFLALFAAYISLRVGAGSGWPRGSERLAPLLGGGMTIALLLGSWSMLGAVTAARKGSPERARAGIAGGMAAGLLFLAGQIIEYIHLLGDGGMRPARSLFDATFLALTGFHGAHVLAGVIYLGMIAARAGKRGEQGTIAVAALYWHFVDAIWLLLFLMLYII